MAVQLSVSVRNARLDAVEATIGAAGILRIRSGAMPANCAAADAGTVLSTVTLPSDWAAAAASGQKTFLGTWQDASADGTGTAGHFRLYDSGGTVCHLQGTITATGGGGDMEVNNTSFATGQTFNVSAFTLIDANA